MISKEIRDSLTKTPARTGIRGSRPLDLDLTVQDEGIRRSNLGRPWWIGWPEIKRVSGAAAGLAGALLRGGARPEETRSGALGSKRGAAWPGRKLVARVNFLGGCWAPGRSGARGSATMAARGGEVRRWGRFGPCRCWVSAGKGPGNTRKTRLALGYALCGLVHSAEGFAAARRC